MSRPSRLSRLLAWTLLLAAPFTTAVAQHPSRTAGTIPQVARTAGQFTTLLAAVEAAGLTETLIGRGPFTVFAPTDDAFKRLPDGTVSDLLKPENRDRLRTILTYHVVAGRVTAAEARAVRRAQTLAGQPVRLSESNGELRVNDATVRIADVPASNGLIHIIDRVLIPEERAAAGSSAGSSAGRTAVALVDYAVDRGAALLNDGQASATVAVYEVVITSLLALDEREIGEETRQQLRMALRASHGSSRSRALELRRALDDARRLVSGRMNVADRRS